MHKLTYEDPLTGLPNHSRAVRSVRPGLASPCRTTVALAYAVIDLDGFDEMNDAVGYAGGDEVLIEVANRLREIAPNAVVARLRSDEFALLMAACDREGRAADRGYGSARHRPAPSGSNQFVQVIASVGLAVAPRDGTVPRGIDPPCRPGAARRQAARSRRRGCLRGRHGGEIRRAALHQARGRPRDRCAAPSTCIISRSSRRTAAPSSASRRCCAGTTRARGAIPPAVFVPVAEEAGLMDQLGEFVLRRALPTPRAGRISTSRSTSRRSRCATAPSSIWSRRC